MPGMTALPALDAIRRDVRDGDVRDGTTEVFSQIASQFSPAQIDGDSGVGLVFAEVVTGSDRGGRAYLPALT